ncbi:MAG: AMP-binding protein [Candidatus Latescibacteria bacterium]|nr:AMP-binding protein [Candidatus Latescibacterota bacterium]
MARSESVANFATDVIDLHASTPGMVALEWFDDQGDVDRVTFRDFSIRSCKVANMLTREGISRGDRVLIMLPLCLEWWEIILGCMRAGIVAVLSSEASTDESVREQIQHSDAESVVVGTEHADLIETLASEMPQIKNRILIGWERDGWIDYDRRVSMSSVDFETCRTLPHEAGLFILPDSPDGQPAMYTHGDSKFDIQLLDAWRQGLMLTLREENAKHLGSGTERLL